MSLSKPVVPAPATQSAVIVPPSQPSGLWDRYLLLLDTQPVQTKAITAAVLSGVSDVLAQSLSKKDKDAPFNWTSFVHQVLIGLFCRGPVVHWWYGVLERWFAGWDPSKFSTAVAKVLADQLIFSPFFNLLYFYLIGFLQGTPLPKIQANIARDFIPLMKNNLKVWPIVNLLNFFLIPPKLRVLFGNLVAVFWVAYVISSTKSR